MFRRGTRSCRRVASIMPPPTSRRVAVVWRVTEWLEGGCGGGEGGGGGGGAGEVMFLVMSSCDLSSCDLSSCDLSSCDLSSQLVLPVAVTGLQAAVCFCAC